MGGGPLDLTWTPPQEIEGPWRLRIDYTQSLRFRDRHIVTLKRALIHSPPTRFLKTNEVLARAQLSETNSFQSE
jgi:hypothetical protein